ncbi:MAG: hypothetical protein NVSMB52_13710 [Chloroflexota bacterium]
MGDTSGVPDFDGRKAPYAPISALEQFFDKIRDRATPDHLDHRYLEKLGVASNNEYALLSALKFLGVIDDRGLPSHAYRLLQSTDRFQGTLRHLVETAYAPAFGAGVDEWSLSEQINYFRVSSSPSQAKNAARFFRAVCRLAGILPGVGPTLTVKSLDAPLAASLPVQRDKSAAETTEDSAGSAGALTVLERARLLAKLPAIRDDWNAAEYAAICDRFLAMARLLV